MKVTKAASGVNVVLFFEGTKKDRAMLKNSSQIPLDPGSSRMVLNSENHILGLEWIFTTATLVGEIVTGASVEVESVLETLDSASVFIFYFYVWSKRARHTMVRV